MGQGQVLRLFEYALVNDHTGEMDRQGSTQTLKQDIPLDEMLDTVTSTSSLKPKGESHSVPSASARATTFVPRSSTTWREMTSSEEPSSGGVYFFLLLRFMPGWIVATGGVKRGRLSNVAGLVCMMIDTILRIEVKQSMTRFT